MQDSLRSSDEDIFSWIISTNGFLSWIGIKVHHPDKQSRISREEAREFLQATEAEILKHTATIEEILLETERQFQELPKQSNPGGWEATDNRRAYDIEKNLRSRRYFKNKSDDIFLTREQVSNDILCKDSISSDHLPLIRRYWTLLRIQYNVLSLQLCCDENKDNLPYSNNVKDCGTTGLLNFTRLPDLTKERSKDDNWESHNCSSSFSSCCTSLEEFNSAVKDKNLNSTHQSTESSPRDDGYYSKAGDSTAEETTSFMDTQSIETDHAKQEVVQNMTTEDLPMTSAVKVAVMDDIDASQTNEVDEATTSRGVWMQSNRHVEEIAQNLTTEVLQSVTSHPVNVAITEDNDASQSIWSGKDEFDDATTSRGVWMQSKRPIEEVPQSLATEDRQTVTSDAVKIAITEDNDASQTMSSRKDEFDEATISRGEWMQINRTVERFSSNTMSLLSWIDELDEVDHNETFSPKFFNSQASRKITINSHIERLYAEVLEDASSLLRNIPSEKETLMTVLRNIEIQCRKVGFFVGDDVEELSSIKPLKHSVDPKSGFLSSKLRQELSVSLPRANKMQSCFLDPISTRRSHNKFAPLAASTPRCVDKNRDHFHETMVPRHTHQPIHHCPNFAQNLEPETCHCHGHTECRHYEYESYAPGRKWIEFMSEYEPVKEWIEMMENLINRAEASKLSVHEVEHLYERYLLGLEQHKTKKEKLATKATYLESLYPELQQKIRIRMTELEELWHSVFIRLTYYSSPFSSSETPTCPEVYDTFDRIIPRRYYLYPEESWVNYWHLLKWRDLLPWFDDNIQLSDFTLHQIRDQLYLDELLPRSKKRILFDIRSSGNSDSCDAIEARPPSITADSELLDSSRKCNCDSHWLERIDSELDGNVLRDEERDKSPFMKPKHRTVRSPVFTTENYDSNWVEFEGIESEIDRSVLCDEERHKSPFLRPKHQSVRCPISRSKNYDSNWLEFEGIESEIDRSVLCDEERHKSPFLRPKHQSDRCPITRSKNYDSNWVEFEGIESEIDRSVLCDEERHKSPFLRPKHRSVRCPITRSKNYDSNWVEFEGIESEIDRSFLSHEEQHKSPLLRPNQRRVDSPRTTSKKPTFNSSWKSSSDSNWAEFEGIEPKTDRHCSCDERHQSSPFMIPKHRRVCSPRATTEKSSRERESSIDQTSHSESIEELSSASSSKVTISKPYHYVEVKMPPTELSDRIHTLHRWLELVEKDAYNKSGIGWEQQHVRMLLHNNQDRMSRLKRANCRLENIMLASEEMLKNHGREVSEFCLMWSSWMLEQRYYNLILYTVDMDCILERRDEVIQKGSVERRISHPLDGIWVDGGEDMQASVETTDEDYNIYWTV